MIHRFVDLQRLVGFPISVSSHNDWAYIGLAGGNVELTDKTTDYYDVPANPLLSPDGTKIVAQGNFPGPNGEGQISWIPVAGGVPTVISPDDAAGPWMFHPDWHPNSASVVYVHAGGSGFPGSIVTVDLSDPGNETVLYTPSPLGGATGFGAYRPRYSPDGSQIAFVLNNEGGSANQSLAGLYVMDADGSNVTQLDTWGTGGGASYSFEGDQFCWTPDSSQIVYTTFSFAASSDNQIYLINADGTGKTLLTTDGTTSALTCLISSRAMISSSSAVITAGIGTGTVRCYECPLDASGCTVLDASHGPFDNEYFRTCFVHANRIWFIENRTPGTVASIALDGSDYRVETTLSTSGTDATHLDGDPFPNGYGVVFT